jgi:hypothetical protein
MIAVITGDIINSREGKASDWLMSLKNALNRYGNSSEDWEVFRGDSFQLKTNIESSLEACLYIKSCIKQFSALDVRMAIGIGNSKGPIGKITEEQGEAFYRSGECFENLKSDHLAVNTGDEQQDTILNLMLDLGLLTFNAWSSVDSVTLKVILEHPDYTQKQIAELLKKAPSTISFTLQKVGYKEIQSLLKYYKSIMLKQ